MYSVCTDAPPTMATAYQIGIYSTSKLRIDDIHMRAGRGGEGQGGESQGGEGQGGEGRGRGPGGKKSA